MQAIFKVDDPQIQWNPFFSVSGRWTDKAKLVADLFGEQDLCFDVQNAQWDTIGHLPSKKQTVMHNGKQFAREATYICGSDSRMDIHTTCALVLEYTDQRSMYTERLRVSFANTGICIPLKSGKWFVEMPYPDHVCDDLYYIFGREYYEVRGSTSSLRIQCILGVLDDFTLPPLPKIYGTSGQYLEWLAGNNSEPKFICKICKRQYRNYHRSGYDLERIEQHMRQYILSDYERILLSQLDNIKKLSREYDLNDYVIVVARPIGYTSSSYYYWQVMATGYPIVFNNELYAGEIMNEIFRSENLDKFKSTMDVTEFAGVYSTIMAPSNKFAKLPSDVLTLVDSGIVHSKHDRIP